MNFECDFEKEYLDTMFYTKEDHNNDELCFICQVDEREDGYPPWTRYKLVCGHVAHSRCCRRWCHVNASISTTRRYPRNSEK